MNPTLEYLITLAVCPRCGTSLTDPEPVYCPGDGCFERILVCLEGHVSLLWYDPEQDDISWSKMGDMPS